MCQVQLALVVRLQLEEQQGFQQVCSWEDRIAEGKKKFKVLNHASGTMPGVSQTHQTVYAKEKQKRSRSTHPSFANDRLLLV